MVAPKAELVLPAIEQALETAPGTKLRQANVEERVAIEAIRDTYRTLTGRKGGRVIRDGQLHGPMIRLGRVIDGIYGTRLFAVRDSRRLR